MEALETAVDIDQVLGWYKERGKALAEGWAYRSSIVGFPKSEK